MICGKAMCLDCRASWGDAADYENKCVSHGDKPTISSAATKEGNPKSKSPAKNHKRKSNTKNNNDGGVKKKKVNKNSQRNT